VASRPALLALAVVLAVSVVSGPLAAGGIRSQLAHGVAPKAGRAVGRIVARWIEVPEPGGDRLRAAVAWPEGVGPAPILIVLHGTEGFRDEDALLAESFARGGFLTVAGCWFGGDECPRGPAFRGVTPDATRHIRTLIGAAAGLARARADRVALFGHSRGGMLALLAASTGLEVQAVVVSSAQFVTGYTAHRSPRPVDVTPLSLLPGLRAPVLMLHAVGDPTSDVRDALAYEHAAHDAGKPLEAYYYDVGVHRLAFEPAVRDDVIRRVVRFLRRHLAP
jgi:dienelactone hydrolase